MAEANGETYTDNVAVAQFFHRMERLRQTRFAPDVVIEGIDGECVFAHKIVLATRFPHLQGSLSKLTATSQLTDWSSYSADIINKMVVFAYTGSIAIDISNARQIFLLSIAVRAASLTEFCQRFILRRHLDVFVTGRKEGLSSRGEAQIVKFDPLSRREEVLGVVEHPGYGYVGGTSVCAVEDRVFLVGPLDRVSSFNVATRRPQPVASMGEGRGLCAVAASRDELLVCGGWGSGFFNVLTSCELLHVGRDEWQRMPSLQQARFAFQVVWLPTGHIFAIGGYAGGGRSYLNSVEFLTRRWDGGGGGAAAEGWRFVAPMLTGRGWFGAVSLEGREILVAGGENREGKDLNSAELFAPASERGQWTQLQPMRTAMRISSGVVSNGAVLMFGYEEKEKIQRLKPRAGEGKDRWEWDEVDSLQSVNYTIRATSFK